MLTQSQGRGRSAGELRETSRPPLVQGVTADRQLVTAALLDLVARDLVRPVMLIAGAAAGLRSGRSSGGQPRDELLSVIETETASLEKSLYLVLEMAKLERDGCAVRAKGVMLAELVGALVHDCRDELRDRKVETILPAEPLQVRLDPLVLRRVLRILLEKAVAQSPPQSTVTIQAARDDTAVRLQVMDHGGGISGRADRLFEPFTFAADATEQPALGGIGLAICRGYVEAMGGTITAANRTDCSGTVFTLTFPMSE